MAGSRRAGCSTRLPSREDRQLSSPAAALRSATARLRGRLAERGRRWALRRQGSDPARLQLSSPRIYILPTPSGLAFAMLVVTLLAGAMNYNNNLGLALGFVLAGLGIASIYHAHGILDGLQLQCLGAGPAFAGEALRVRFLLQDGAGIDRREVFLGWSGGEPVAAGPAAHATRCVELPLATRRRGWQALPALRVQTRAPLGLVRAWSWVHPAGRLLVYPQPAPAGSVPPPVTTTAGDTGGRQQPRGDDSFAGLRGYQPGDEPRRIVWRRYLRNAELVVRQQQGSARQAPASFDWDAMAGHPDARAARLARLVLDASASGASWSLRLPGIELGPAGGQQHLHRCLAALATAGLPASEG